MFTWLSCNFESTSQNMDTLDIPVDKAELLSVLLEGVLYGSSLLMFGGTIWSLVSGRSTDRVNYKMFVLACMLLVFSTTHLVIDIIRAMEGFVLYRDTYPGGPIAYFSDVSQWTFVCKNYVFAAQTLIGDGVVLYRCYAVWKSKLVMILPALLWCAVGVTGILSPYIESRAKHGKVFGWYLADWITSFYAMTFTTNLLTTLLLACRIWYIDRKATRQRGHQSTRMRPILNIIIEAGVIYSLTLLAEMICFSVQSNAQYVILDMITPIISITFYMVIVRVGVANQLNATGSVRLSTRNGFGADRRSGVMLAHVTASTEHKIDNSRRAPNLQECCAGAGAG